jgi:hypothetical protein
MRIEDKYNMTEKQQKLADEAQEVYEKTRLKKIKFEAFREGWLLAHENMQDMSVLGETARKTIEEAFEQSFSSI